MHSKLEDRNGEVFQGVGGPAYPRVEECVCQLLASEEEGEEDEG